MLTCTSGQAYDLRQDMKTMMLEGMTDAEVIREVEQRFGQKVTNPPQPWYTFFVPFLPWMVGLSLVVWALRRWLRRGENADAPPIVEDTGADAERLARLRRQVAQED